MDGLECGRLLSVHGVGAGSNVVGVRLEVVAAEPQEQQTADESRAA